MLLTFPALRLKALILLARRLLLKDIDNVDPFGKRRYKYSMDLIKLREIEKSLIKDQLDGLDVYAAGKADLNFVFDRYISTKTDLRRTTYTNYTYMYDRFVRPEFGKKKIGTIKYSDVLYF